MLQSPYIANLNLQSANKFLFQFCKKHSDLNAVITVFEASLKENEELHQIQERLIPQVDNLNIDLMLLHEAVTTLQEERAQNIMSLRLAQICYGQLIEIDGLITDGKVKNISRFTVLCKQNEVLQELRHIEEHKKYVAARNVGMENRQIVNLFRGSQKQLVVSNNELLSIEKEVEYVTRQWKLKLERAVKHRNKKIVTVVTYAQIRMHVTKQLNLSEMHCLFVREPHQPPQTGQRTPSNKFFLQSALDFFTNYPEERIATKMITHYPTDFTNTAKNSHQLRSILLNNRLERIKKNSDIDLMGVKHVQFAQMPTYHHYIIGDDNSMSFDALVQAVDPQVHELIEKDATEEPYPEKPKVLNVEILSQALENPTISKSTEKNGSLTFENLFESVLANRTDYINKKTSKLSVNKIDSNIKPLVQAEQDVIMTHRSSDNIHFSEQACDANDDFFFDFSNETCNNEGQLINSRSYNL